MATARTSSQEHRLQEQVASLEKRLARKDAVIAEVSEELVKTKRAWGALTGAWVPHDTRETLVDFVHRWTATTELPCDRFVAWLGISRSKFYAWRQRYGKANGHNASVPRDHWILDEERAKILAFFARYPMEGYRRLAFMMLDQAIVAVSPSSVYRVLARAGLMARWNRSPSKKGTGFVQPLAPHEHWHIDIAYLNVCGTFFYLCSILDGASRKVLHWEIRESMKESEVECVLQAAREKYPGIRSQPPI